MRLIALVTVLLFSASTVGPSAAAILTDASEQAPQTSGATATVTTQAPIFIKPGAPTPLRVAAVGTTLNVTNEDGDWAEVEFRDPQVGIRVGWVESKLMRISRPGLEPMDLTVKTDAPRTAVPEPRRDAAVVNRGLAVREAREANDTMPAGLLDGEMLAEGTRTGGKLGAGLGFGVLTGLIGTGIGFFVIGPEAMTPAALQHNLGKSPEYQIGFKSGWDKKTQSKKRNAFLAGGLLGTAAFVAFLVSAQGQ